MKAEKILFDSIQKALKELYSINSTNISFQKTRKEFEGDFTLVTFPFIKESKRPPEQLGKELGEFLLKNNADISGYNVIKGFLNISLSDQFWLEYFNSVKDQVSPGCKPALSS